MQNIHKPLSFEFTVKPVLSLDGVYTCDDLPDRKIMISRMAEDVSKSITTKSGGQTKLNFGDRYLCSIIFHATGYSFNYELTINSMSNLSAWASFMSWGADIPSVSVETRIENQLANCYFNFVNEDDCKQALNAFGITFPEVVSGIVFGRKVTDGLEHFTIDYKDGDITYQKSYLYDEEKSVIYEKTNNKSGMKFGKLFESTYFSESWFFFYKSLHCDSFKLHIMDSKDKKYTKLNYHQGALTVLNYEGEVVSVIEGDEFVNQKINQIIHQKIIHTPSAQFKNYVKEFNLDLYQLSMEDILVINMVDY